MRGLLSLSLLLPAFCCARLLGDDAKLETIHLKDGRTFQGLVEAERKSEIDFAEVVRPRGKPMYAVVRPIDKKLVTKIERLPPEERERLVEQFQAFRNRARIETGRREDVLLTQVPSDARRRRYEGNWFTLDSTADDETTRKAVVRIDQIFRAYRQVLPPRREPRTLAEIRLHGSLAEYRADLAERKLAIESPAFYSPSLNLIVAGSDLARYSHQLALTRAKNEATRQHYESLQADFSERQKKLAEELKRNGFPREEIGEEIRLRKRAWEEEIKSRFSEIAEANRRNDALFGDVTRQMFARLNHEAFHAYLENFVYPSDEGPMPRWLNEGLAQVFETAQLDGDVLRIDAPHRETLFALQTDLAGEPLPLAELLSARESEFLVSHARGASRRHYLYSWGLAYYLAFHQNRLGSASLGKYLGPTEIATSSLTRFEQLVGMTLPEFEKRWRTDMLALKPPAK
jgi:hypothetical protein